MPQSVDPASLAQPAWSAWLIDTLRRPVARQDRERAAVHLMDWLACAHLGRAGDAGHALARWAVKQPTGSAWACGHTGLQPADAARMNGSLSSAHELDDVHREAVVHPGDTVIPAALAMAQREGSSADELLDALVIGYEAGIRMSLLAGRAHYRHWYSTATTGVFASAMACAHLLHLSPRQQQHALALAGMQASGVWQCRMEPGVAKQMATGHSAQAGLVAADLAAAGAAGPASILEGEHGWLQATGSLVEGLADPVSAQRHLQAGSTAPWLMHAVSFKPWPACRHVHPAIGCALKAHALGLAPQQIARLSLVTYAVALTFADQPMPTTPYAARFSLQHAVAWALCHGDFWLEASTPAGWSDPVCAALRACVQLSCGPEHEQRYPQRFSASLTVHMQDGSTHVCEEDSAWGDPEQPMSIADLQAKAHRMLVDVGVRDHDARALIAHCLALPGSGDLAPWWARLQALPQAQDVFIG